MNKLWKVVIISIGIVVAVVLYMRYGKEPQTVNSEGVSVISSSGDGTAQLSETDRQEEIGTDAKTDGSGFTEEQKAELYSILKDTVSEIFEGTVDRSVRTALENCLKEMMEDGRLGAAITEYTAVQTGLININTAGVEELVKLNGIGNAKAMAIIAYREEHGPFTAVEQLTNVSGISTGTLEKFRDQVTL